jgi:hypothetical protein
MSAGVVAIVCAVLAGSGLPIWFLERFDKRNTQQHKDNLSVLNLIKNDIEAVKEDTKQVRFQLGRHIEWHVTKEEPSDIEGTITKPTKRRKMPSGKVT